jgi:hypothetical protein
MNENEQELENLVMFPSAKNYPKSTPECEDDPLESLLNEFSEYDDDDFEDDADELENSAVQEKMDIAHSLGQNDCLELIHQQISSLNEAKARIRHFLNEIELHIPKRK